MRHILLRFNYAVEIGANLAYMGHYYVTKDKEILKIANEELNHKRTCENILKVYKLKPFWGFNLLFIIIGNIIQKLCRISPKKLLNLVAKSMEIFAIFNYNKMALLYPEYKNIFTEMSNAEKRHKNYFERLK